MRKLYPVPKNLQYSIPKRNRECCNSERLGIIRLSLIRKLRWEQYILEKRGIIPRRSISRKIIDIANLMKRGIKVICNR